MTSRRAFYKTKTVLVVDDSDQIRSYLKSMLLLIGFDDVTLARDAEMALAFCRSRPFPVIPILGATTTAQLATARKIRSNMRFHIHRHRL